VTLLPDTLIWRSRILASKISGSLPALPPAKLPGLLLSRIEDWDYRYFVLPAQTDNEGRTVYRTPFGEFYGRPEDRSSLGAVVVEEIARIYERPPVMIHRGDVVLDLGANLGTFTRIALNSGARLVVAFEADADNAGCFRQTFREELANGSVILVESPLWSECRTVHFSGHGLVGQISDEGRPMEAVTIDSTIRALGLTAVDFIKSDIEGAERQALAGASETTRRFSPKMAISSYHFPDDPRVLESIVCDFHPYTISWDKGRKRMFCHSLKRANQA
jgi:FkbM family methyltransferase